MENNLFYLKLMELCLTPSLTKRILYKREIKRLLDMSNQKGVPLVELIDRQYVDLLIEAPLHGNFFNSFYTRLRFYEILSELFC